jgi:hypothetical protein
LEFKKLPVWLKFGLVFLLIDGIILGGISIGLYIHGSQGSKFVEILNISQLNIAKIIVNSTDISSEGFWTFVFVATYILGLISWFVIGIGVGFIYGIIKAMKKKEAKI